jgi:hypothetical protein
LNGKKRFDIWGDMSSRSDFSLIIDSIAPLEMHSWLESRPNGSAIDGASANRD